MISGNFLKNKKVRKRLLRFIHLFLQTFPSYFFVSTFCVQKMPEIEFYTPKSLENQLELIQFSEILVGPDNLPHHPITCRSPHNLPFFRTRKTSYCSYCYYSCSKDDRKSKPQFFLVTLDNHQCNFQMGKND